MFFTLEDYRKIEEYLKQNSKKDTDFENLDVTHITPDDSVAIVHNLLNKQVNVFDLLSSDITGFFTRERQLLEAKIREFLNLINTFTIEKIGLSDYFGDSKISGVSLYALTQAFNDVWNKLLEITGESSGINVTITPDVFVSEEASTVLVAVTAANMGFEKSRIYVNGSLVVERDHTYGLTEDITIEETSTVTTVIQIMGREYTDIKTVTKLFPFFIGSGTMWQDVETIENALEYKGHLDGSYNVTVHNNGEKIYVIIPKRLAYQMIRVDMDGFEVPMITHEEDDQLIYESTNTYIAGTYNIEIVCKCNCSTQESVIENAELNNG